MSKTTRFQLTSGTRDLGYYPSFSKAAARAAQISSRQFCDMAIWHGEELLAVSKDSELIPVGYQLALADCVDEDERIIDLDSFR